MASRSPALVIDPFLLGALHNPRDRMVLLKLDQELERFLLDSSVHNLEFPPMTSYHRMLLYRVSQFFGIEHSFVEHVESDGSIGKQIVLSKTRDSRIPALRLGDLSADEAASSSLAPVRIMRRPDSERSPERVPLECDDGDVRVAVAGDSTAGDVQGRAERVSERPARDSKRRVRRDRRAGGVALDLGKDSGKDLTAAPRPGVKWASASRADVGAEPSGVASAARVTKLSERGRRSRSKKDSSKSFEEREEDYLKARARIFASPAASALPVDATSSSSPAASPRANSRATDDATVPVPPMVHFPYPAPNFLNDSRNLSPPRATRPEMAQDLRLPQLWGSDLPAERQRAAENSLSTVTSELEELGVEEDGSCGNLPLQRSVLGEESAPRLSKKQRQKMKQKEKQKMKLEERQKLNERMREQLEAEQSKAPPSLVDGDHADAGDMRMGCPVDGSTAVPGFPTGAYLPPHARLYDPATGLSGVGPAPSLALRGNGARGAFFSEPSDVVGEFRPGEPHASFVRGGVQATPGIADEYRGRDGHSITLPPLFYSSGPGSEDTLYSRFPFPGLPGSGQVWWDADVRPPKSAELYDPRNDLATSMNRAIYAVGEAGDFPCESETRPRAADELSCDSRPAGGSICIDPAENSGQGVLPGGSKFALGASSDSGPRVVAPSAGFAGREETSSTIGTSQACDSREDLFSRGRSRGTASSESMDGDSSSTQHKLMFDYSVASLAPASSYFDFEDPPKTAFDHILEVYDFPHDMGASGLDALLSEVKSGCLGSGQPGGSSIRYLDDGTVLAVFRSSVAARVAMDSISTGGLFKLRLWSPEGFGEGAEHQDNSGTCPLYVGHAAGEDTRHGEAEEREASLVDRRSHGLERGIDGDAEIVVDEWEDRFQALELAGTPAARST